MRETRIDRESFRRVLALSLPSRKKLGLDRSVRYAHYKVLQYLTLIICNCRNQRCISCSALSHAPVCSFAFAVSRGSFVIKLMIIFLSLSLPLLFNNPSPLASIYHAFVLLYLSYRPAIRIRPSPVIERQPSGTQSGFRAAFVLFRHFLA